MLWMILSLAVLFFWLTSKEKPPYYKHYYETRLDGAFGGSYDGKFVNYLQHIKKETKARVIVGPISPLDDLYAKLYHPELPENWQRFLYPNQVAYKAKQVTGFIVWVIIGLLVSDGITRILTDGYGLLYGIGTDRYIFKKFLAIGFAVGACSWLNRRRHAESQTQGYLDGYSDCYLDSLSEVHGTVES